MSDDAPIKVFISYAQESSEHKQRVLEVAQRLRGDQVDCTIDQFVNGSPSEGWPLWMERQVQQADFVLVVCTPTYLRRYEAVEQAGKGLGATWEAILTRQELYEGQADNRKFIPVVFESGTTDRIPKPLRPYTYYKLSERYDELLRHLTQQPATVPQPLGRRRILPPL